MYALAHTTHTYTHSLSLSAALKEYKRVYEHILEMDKKLDQAKKQQVCAIYRTQACRRVTLPGRGGGLPFPGRAGGVITLPGRGGGLPFSGVEEGCPSRGMQEG